MLSETFGLYLLENPCIIGYKQYTKKKALLLHLVLIPVLSAVKQTLQPFLGKVTPKYNSFHISGLLPLDRSVCRESARLENLLLSDTGW